MAGARSGAAVAVVGAGMAGATCARGLADAGLTVRVLDKGRSVGGRLAQRRVEAGVFDHGAQYLAARHPDFADALGRWRDLGLVAPWPGVTSGSGAQTLVGVPAMSAPVEDLLGGVPVRSGFRATALEHRADGWTIRGEGDPEGPFAAVVLALPAPQAVALLAETDAARLLVPLGSVRMAPCWSAMAAFGAPAPAAAPALRFAGDLVWAARNASKPGRASGETWTLHAGPDWSRAWLERGPEEVAPALWARFAGELGGELCAPVWLAAHRWRYALVERPLGAPFLWDPGLRLGLCGDWCLGPNVEAAWLSGRALAAALANAGMAG